MFHQYHFLDIYGFLNIYCIVFRAATAPRFKAFKKETPAALKSSKCKHTHFNLTLNWT